MLAYYNRQNRFKLWWIKQFLIFAAMKHSTATQPFFHLNLVAVLKLVVSDQCPPGYVDPIISRELVYSLRTSESGRCLTARKVTNDESL